MAADKTRLGHLADATAQEILEELKRRRNEALQFCSEGELEEELSKRTGYDGPRRVEK